MNPSCGGAWCAHCGTDDGHRNWCPDRVSDDSEARAMAAVEEDQAAWAEVAEVARACLAASRDLRGSVEALASIMSPDGGAA